MITEANFKKFEPIVLEAVDELFKHCIDKEVNENDFLVFLENGHYDEKLIGTGNYPFVIGQGVAGLKDYDRMAFVQTFANIPFEKHYNETDHLQEKFDIRRNSTALSMMVYVHFWESKVFLRRLRLLAMFCEGHEYDWKLIVKPTNTYSFIKNKIREVFKNKNLKIYSIIKDAYKSQLRNAFAHSDYYLSDNKVYLENYDSSDKWSIPYISFEDFDEIIIKTLMIHHAITSKTDDYRKLLGESCNTREIYIPDNGGLRKNLKYETIGDVHRWVWEVNSK